MTRRHLCIVLDGPQAEPLEALRRHWGPVMAARAPAHVTLTYPEETGDENLLLERARHHAARTPAGFSLRLGGLRAEDGGRGGVFFAVEDVDGGWARLRRELLAPPFRSLGYPPHVTIVHPRTSRRGERCFAELSADPAILGLRAEFRVTGFLFTETATDTDAAFTVLRRFPLRTT